MKASSFLSSLYSLSSLSSLSSFPPSLTSTRSFVFRHSSLSRFSSLSPSLLSKHSQFIQEENNEQEREEREKHPFIKIETVREEEEGLSLGKWIFSRYSLLPFSLFQKLLRNKKVILFFLPSSSLIFFRKIIFSCFSSVFIFFFFLSKFQKIGIFRSDPTRTSRQVLSVSVSVSFSLFLSVPFPSFLSFLENMFSKINIKLINKKIL